MSCVVLKRRKEGSRRGKREEKRERKKRGEFARKREGEGQTEVRHCSPRNEEERGVRRGGTDAFWDYSAAVAYERE